MAVADGRISDIPVKVADFWFQENVPMKSIQGLLMAKLYGNVIEAGKSYDIVPYGTEAPELYASKKDI